GPAALNELTAGLRSTDRRDATLGRSRKSNFFPVKCMTKCRSLQKYGFNIDGWLKKPQASKFSAQCDSMSCIIPLGVDATSSEFWQRRKIPPLSSLDGRVGRRS